MKASEIREMNPDELDDELENIERKLFEIRTQSVTEKLEDPTLITKAKRDIARLLTVARQRELAAQTPADAVQAQPAE